MDDLELAASYPLPPPRLLLNNFARATVLLVGDVMLDEYVWGDVRRISPEAPVPVVEVRERSYMPGGAANVANNIAHLSGHVHLGGVVGRDDAGKRLRALLQDAQIDTEGLISDSTRPTTTKLRIVAHSQQLARVDFGKAPRAGCPTGGRAAAMGKRANGECGSLCAVRLQQGRFVAVPDSRPD